MHKFLLKYLKINEKSFQKTTFNLILFFIICVFVYNHFLFNPLAEESIIKVELTGIEKETLSSLKEMTNLLISLAVALFAMIGYYSLERLKNNIKLEFTSKIDLMLALSFITISIDFGYIYLSKLVELLSIGTFNSEDFIIAIPHKMQIYSFLLSLLFSGRLIFRNLLNL